MAVLAVLLLCSVALLRRRAALHAALSRRAAHAAPLDTTVIDVPRLTLVRSMGDELAALGLLLLFAMSWLLSTLAMRGLGAWDPAGALTVQFAIEPAPEGQRRFINAGWERSAVALKRVSTALQHSNPYLSQAALGQIGAALAHGLEAGRGRAAT